jgi:chemotaxis receptor (MCP) glutamine deamidase CheD
LESIELMPGSLRLLRQQSVDIGERGGTVNLRFAGSQQIQIGSVQDQNRRHERSRELLYAPRNGEMVATWAAIVHQSPEAVQHN